MSPFYTDFQMLRAKRASFQSQNARIAQKGLAILPLAPPKVKCDHF